MVIFDVYFRLRVADLPLVDSQASRPTLPPSKNHHQSEVCAVLPDVGVYNCSSDKIKVRKSGRERVRNKRDQRQRDGVRDVRVEVLACS